MILGLIGALVLIGAGFALIVRAFAMGRLKMVRAISQIDSYGYSAPAASPTPSGGAAGPSVERAAP